MSCLGGCGRRGVLGEVAGELRVAARNAAAVTSEQSAAVAQTSQTIQQLAASAGSIAGTVRAVSQAAERTGRMMGEVQEKAEAFAARALSLGERAQQIGEILELITDIAGQTNTLALNAAIEAARAGGCGAGVRGGGGGGAEPGKAVGPVDGVNRGDHRGGAG